MKKLSITLFLLFPLALHAMNNNNPSSPSRAELRKDFKVLVSYCGFLQSTGRVDDKAQFYYNKTHALAATLFKEEEVKIPAPIDPKTVNPYNSTTQHDEWTAWEFDRFQRERYRKPSPCAINWNTVKKGPQ